MRGSWIKNDIRPNHHNILISKSIQCPFCPTSITNPFYVSKVNFDLMDTTTIASVLNLCPWTNCDATFPLSELAVASFMAYSVTGVADNARAGCIMLSVVEDFNKDQLHPHAVSIKEVEWERKSEIEEICIIRYLMWRRILWMEWIRSVNWLKMKAFVWNWKYTEFMLEDVFFLSGHFGMETIV